MSTDTTTGVPSPRENGDPGPQPDDARRHLTLPRISGRGNPAVRPFYCCRNATSASMTSSGSSRISASKARNRL